MVDVSHEIAPCDTAMIYDIKGDGTALVRMQPNSFAIVEW